MKLLIKNSLVLLFSGFILFFITSGVSAQTFLGCGNINCNGDTRPCGEGLSCTYLANSVCGANGPNDNNTICVPSPPTGDRRGEIPETTYLGANFERRQCTAEDTGNNFLFHTSAPGRVWTQQEVLDLVCNSSPEEVQEEPEEEQQQEQQQEENNELRQPTELPKTSQSDEPSDAIRVAILFGSLVAIFIGIFLKFKSYKS